MSNQLNKQLIKTVIRDWRLHEDDEAASTIPISDQAEYDVVVEPGETGFNFSVVDKETNALSSHGINNELGLHGFLEIRDGVPTLSLGLYSDSNIIHVASNNMNELSVIRECELPQFKPEWRTVEHTERKFTGLCFDEKYLNADIIEARKTIAEKALKEKYGITDMPVVSVDDRIDLFKCTFERSENGIAFDYLVSFDEKRLTLVSSIKMIINANDSEKDALVELIMSDSTVNDTIANNDCDSEEWTVLEIHELVLDALDIDLNLEDTDLFGELLKRFNEF